MFTLLNPHAHDFIAEPVAARIKGRRALKKYHYLLEGLLAEGTPDVLINGYISSIIPQQVFAYLPSFVRHAFLRWEVRQWLEMNHLQGKVRVHWSPDTIADKRLLYFFAYKAAIGRFDKKIDMLEAFTHKLANHSHVMLCSKEKGENLKKLTGLIHTSEADLRKSPYFQTFFRADEPFIALPFEVPERFKNTKPFSERMPKAAATGTFHELHSELMQSHLRDFLEFYKIDHYHPVRRLIYDHKEALADIISCRISPYREGKKSLLGKLLARFDISQKSYFAFDIVEFYNSHRYAIIGEEVHGLPAVGAFEAMACGCLLLGAKGDYYDALSMQPGVHYVEHDGTLEDIRAKIDWLNQNPEIAARIAQSGYELVNAHCSGKQLFSRLTQELKALI